ncbi:hypothetical protein [Streptomyces sp. NPDC092903]|uniref:hypothetical protein n=1 Tax=Streptomyces sp. NPDC092903 TaxID=3366017 RepID=UPI0038049EA9
MGGMEKGIAELRYRLFVARIIDNRKRIDRKLAGLSEFFSEVVTDAVLPAVRQ